MEKAKGKRALIICEVEYCIRLCLSYKFRQSALSGLPQPLYVHEHPAGEGLPLVVCAIECMDRFSFPAQLMYWFPLLFTGECGTPGLKPRNCIDLTYERHASQVEGETREVKWFDGQIAGSNQACISADPASSMEPCLMIHKLMPLAKAFVWRGTSFECGQKMPAGMCVLCHASSQVSRITALLGPPDTDRIGKTKFQHLCALHRT